ncbi:unnamed protein product [Trifolium pratense]|uniref:Uncharacterized protein n=1 Tax=Trifolium pratense TaxID=57577 RepID=A0ACB0L3I3_TRIPR|nr:unnamed protein product [Trifolium pratense]
MDSASPSKEFDDLENDTPEEWIPPCGNELKPVIGKVFDTLTEGVDFYKNYAHAVGFSVRSSSEIKEKDGVNVRWKYLVCSKEGFKEEKKIDTPELLVTENNLSKSRKRKLTRQGCKAKIVFKRTDEGKYEVSKFDEGHSHGLVTPTKKQFLRSARSVNDVHKNLWLSCERSNVGTSKF